MAPPGHSNLLAPHGSSLLTPSSHQLCTSRARSLPGKTSEEDKDLPEALIVSDVTQNHSDVTGAAFGDTAHILCSCSPDFSTTLPSDAGSGSSPTFSPNRIKAHFCWHSEICRALFPPPGAQVAMAPPNSIQAFIKGCPRTPNTQGINSLLP